jgi:hypothetical protein
MKEETQPEIKGEQRQDMKVEEHDRTEKQQSNILKRNKTGQME